MAPSEAFSNDQPKVVAAAAVVVIETLRVRRKRQDFPGQHNNNIARATNKKKKKKTKDKISLSVCVCIYPACLSQKEDRRSKKNKSRLLLEHTDDRTKEKESGSTACRTLLLYLLHYST